MIGYVPYHEGYGREDLKVKDTQSSEPGPLSHTPMLGHTTRQRETWAPGTPKSHNSQEQITSTCFFIVGHVNYLGHKSGVYNFRT